MFNSIIKCTFKSAFPSYPIHCVEAQAIQAAVAQAKIAALAKLERRLDQSSCAPAIAANETARVWGDPHFEDPDGGKFDVQGEAGKIYQLLSDSGLQFNGRFDGVGNGITVVGETGLSVNGPRGTSQVQFSKEGRALLNGQPLQPGHMESLADGGHVLLSEDGKTLTLKSAEGYTITQKSAPDGLDIRVKTPLHGVASEGRMPGGLLGQTFDADKLARNSSDKQGAGAINGAVHQYEVPGGLYGNTVASMNQNPVFDAGQFIMNEATRIQNANQISESESKTKRLLDMMMMALRSGNIDLAMMIFSSLEANAATEMTKMLGEKLVKAQENRRALTANLAKAQDDKEKGQGEATKIGGQITDTNDSIQQLTQFIKEVAEQKNRTAEFTSNFLNSEHQTTMSLVRGMRG